MSKDSTNNAPPERILADPTSTPLSLRARLTKLREGAPAPDAMGYDEDNDMYNEQSGAFGFDNDNAVFRDDDAGDDAGDEDEDEDQPALSPSQSMPVLSPGADADSGSSSESDEDDDAHAAASPLLTFSRSSHALRHVSSHASTVTPPSSPGPAPGRCPSPLPLPSGSSLAASSQSPPQYYHTLDPNFGRALAKDISELTAAAAAHTQTHVLAPPLPHSPPPYMPKSASTLTLSRPRAPLSRPASTTVMATRDLPLTLRRTEQGIPPPPGAIVSACGRFWLQWVGRAEWWGQLRGAVARMQRGVRDEDELDAGADAQAHAQAHAHDLYADASASSLPSPAPAPARVLWAGLLDLQALAPPPTPAETDLIVDFLQQHDALPVLVDPALRTRYDRFCTQVLVPVAHFGAPQLAHDSPLPAEDLADTDTDPYAAFLAGTCATDAPEDIPAPLEPGCGCGPDIDDLWTAFTSVALAFATAVAAATPSPHAAVWIHSLHLSLLPEYLRTKLPLAHLALSIHSPFPASEVLRALPHRGAMLRSLLACDVLGVHAYDYARHLISSARRVLNIHFRSLADGSIQLTHAGNRTMLVVAPASIDAAAHQPLLQSANFPEDVARWQARWPGKRIVLSVSDFEPLESGATRLLAYRRLLLLRTDAVFVDVVGGVLAPVLAALHAHAVEHAPEWATRPFWAVLQELLELAQTHYERALIHADGRFASSPLQYYPSLASGLPPPPALAPHLVQTLAHAAALWYSCGPHAYVPLPRRALLPPALLSLFAAARVGLFLPLWHGITLAPLHFIAAQDEQHPGVPLLSSLLGFAPAFPQAPQTHPLHLPFVVALLDRALSLPLAQRAAIHEACWLQTMRRSLPAWARLSLQPRHRAGHTKILCSGLADLRLVRVRADLHRVQPPVLYHAAKHASSMLLLVDYDGTLVPQVDHAPRRRMHAHAHKQAQAHRAAGRGARVGAVMGDLRGEDAAAHRAAIKAIEAVAALHSAYIFVVSSRTRADLRGVFSPRVGLVAEGGVCVRWPQQLRAARASCVAAFQRDQPATKPEQSAAQPGLDEEGWEWLCATHVCAGDCAGERGGELCWRQQCLSLMRAYVEQTDGAWVEAKEATLEWHLGNADAQLGAWQAAALSKALAQALPRGGGGVRVQVHEQQRVLTVRPAGASKGTAAAFLLNAMIGVGGCSACGNQQLQKQQQQQQSVPTPSTPVAAPSAPAISVTTPATPRLPSPPQPLPLATLSPAAAHTHGHTPVHGRGPQVAPVETVGPCSATAAKPAWFPRLAYPLVPHAAQLPPSHPLVAAARRCPRATPRGCANSTLVLALGDGRADEDMYAALDQLCRDGTRVSYAAATAVPCTCLSGAPHSCPRALSYATLTVGLKPTRAHAFVADEAHAQSLLTLLASAHGKPRAQPVPAPLAGAGAAVRFAPSSTHAHAHAHLVPQPLLPLQMQPIAVPVPSHMPPMHPMPGAPRPMSGPAPLPFSPFTPGVPAPYAHGLPQGFTAPFPLTSPMPPMPVMGPAGVPLTAPMTMPMTTPLHMPMALPPHPNTYPLTPLAFAPTVPMQPLPLPLPLPPPPPPLPHSSTGMSPGTAPISAPYPHWMLAPAQLPAVSVSGPTTPHATTEMPQVPTPTAVDSDNSRLFMGVRSVPSVSDLASLFSLPQTQPN